MIMKDNQEGFKKAELILQFLRNELDAAQELEFNEWLEEDAENRAFFEKIASEEGLKQELGTFKLKDTEEAWGNFEMKIQAEQTKTIWNWKSLIQYAAVAAVVSWIGISIFYPKVIQRSQTKTAAYTNDIRSGGNKAILTLANGKEILLDEVADGKLAQQNNMIISKTTAGQVVFDMKQVDDADLSSIKVDPNAYNTITTPRGGDYMLILPDGSKVWLNAASSLQFPVSFAGAERKVILKGEGYFEVKNRKNASFTVIAQGLEVKVLGTHFNINAYEDEAGVTTTLLEGSVKIIKSDKVALLSPGEQAFVNNYITIGQANSEAVAWKDGFTSFKDADIETIMRAVSRWYDIDVKYKSKIPRKLFTGSVSRGANLSEVLNSLQYLGGVHFKIEGRAVIISSQS
jgi:transmembrane sensor